MTISKESKFLAISATYILRYGKGEYTKTLLFPIDWFEVENIYSFADLQEFELNFGKIEDSHSSCYAMGEGFIVTLEEAIQLAKANRKNGYEFDEWHDLEGEDLYEKLFSSHPKEFFDNFRNEFNKLIEEETKVKAEIKVSVPVEKLQEFKEFLKSIEASVEGNNL